jgi:hypothetical protein
MKKPKYADRYVLATGYPFGIEPNIKTVAMAKYATHGEAILLKWPEVLGNGDLPPRYRLVLEKVRGEK